MAKLKKLKMLITSFILIFSIVLRFINIDWGVPLSQTHFPFHPDEQMSMSILNQINVRTGDFVPEEAHVEGSFNYYLWKIYLLVLSKVKILGFPTNQIPFTASNNNYGQALLASRVLTAVFSSLSVIMMLIILNMFTIPYIPKMISLLLYGTNLIEVYYGHFMRPHTLANLLLLLVIYFTFKKKYIHEIYRFILAGIFSGLALATRYNNIAIVIPIIYIFVQFLMNKKWFQLFSFGTITGIFFIIGFFIGDPAVFTNFKQVEPYLRYQSTFIAKEQFSFQNILDFSRVTTYLSYLIPFASFPTSWIIIYVSTLFSLFLKKSRNLIIPLLLFVFIYLFIMAKGYSEPIFVRATLPLFPLLITITAISLKSFWQYQKYHLILTIICTLLLIPSVLFTTFYIIGMSPKNDPRYQMLSFFSQIQTKTPVTIYTPKNWLCDYYIQSTLYTQASRFDFQISTSFPSKPNLYYISCELDPDTKILSQKIKDTQINEIASFKSEIPFLKKYNINKYLPADLMYPYLTFTVYKN